MSGPLLKHFEGEIDIATCLELLQDDYLKAAINKLAAFPPDDEDEVEGEVPLFTERYLFKILSDFNNAKGALRYAQLHYYMEYPDEFEDVLERTFCKADLSNVMTLEEHYKEGMEDPDREYEYIIGEYIDYVDENLSDADRNPEPKKKLTCMVVR